MAPERRGASVMEAHGGNRFEVTVVGGGPAGASTALFLLHHRPELRGQVAILERRRFPREKFCAGALGARGDRLLEDIGVRVQVPSVPMNGAMVTVPGGSRSRAIGSVGRVVRRLEFDAALARAARSRGAELLEGVALRDFRVEESGVEVETSEGPFRCRALVGADGVGSTVRRILGIPFGRLRASAVEVDTEPVRGDPPTDILHFDVSDRRYAGYAWDFATPLRGRTMVSRGVYALSYTGEPLPGVTAFLEERLAAQGLRIGDYRVKRMAERGIELHRPVSRFRVLLVGEAAGIDPITGEGIAPAIQYGAVAGRYLAGKLAVGRLAFRDWKLALAGSTVGVDLSVRRLLAHFCYRSARLPVERLFLDAPGVIRYLTAVFAGRARPLHQWIHRSPTAG